MLSLLDPRIVQRPPLPSFSAQTSHLSEATRVRGGDTRRFGVHPDVIKYLMDVCAEGPATVPLSSRLNNLV